MKTAPLSKQCKNYSSTVLATETTQRKKPVICFSNLPLIRSSRDFTVLSLDGSRQVQSQMQEDTEVTISSILDHYVLRPATTTFEEMKLLHFAQNFTACQRRQDQSLNVTRERVVIVRPYCSPDPSGPKYEQYCQYKLMQHVPFRHDR